MTNKKQTRSLDPVAPATPGLSLPKRRSFLNLLWVGLGAIGLAQLGIVVAGYLAPGRRSPRPAPDNSLLEAGDVSQYAAQTATAFIQGKFYLCCLEDSGFLAVSRQCTHLGCTVLWDGENQQFVCPCHASAYDIRGDVLSPPAPRALDIFQVQIVQNRIRIDTGQRIRRGKFDPRQVVYPQDARPSRG
jgi:cytochrome b6-f complex iron-sulfur subunit